MNEATCDENVKRYCSLSELNRDSWTAGFWKTVVESDLTCTSSSGTDYSDIKAITTELDLSDAFSSIGDSAWTLAASALMLLIA